MPSKRINARSFGWLSALLLTALGLWCTLGLLDIVSGSHGVVRVAMLPPAWAAIALVAVLAGVGIAAARSGRDADFVLPLCAAGLLAVPYLPWLPDRLPILRGLAAPARNLLWFVAVWVVGARALGSVRWRASPAAASLLIFVVSAGVFGAAAWRLTRTAIGDLFSTVSDAAELVKWKDVYDLLEATMDSCEHAANVMETIAIKNA